MSQMPVMKVLYRITGIDGEAKEDFFGPA